MWLKVLSITSVLLPLILGLIYFKNLSKPQKYFLGFIAFSTLIEIISSILSYNNINNFIVFKTFLIFDLAFFLQYYKKCNLSYKWIYYLGNLVLFSCIILEVLFPLFSIKIVFKSYFFIFIFLFLIIQSGAADIVLFDKSEVLPFLNHNFWIASARIFYYLFILFIFLYPSLFGHSFNDKIFNNAFFIINCLANIVLNLMYSKSLLCKQTTL